MKDDRKACGICAWRGTCAKKFSMSAGAVLHCIDYTRDLTIRDKPAAPEAEKMSSEDKGDK
ncbi:hypothetical protein ACFL2A_02450 [Thermodesulfobacteriota bacterium]